jgi:thiol-disulfide isomerase/thioredoxin
MPRKDVVTTKDIASLKDKIRSKNTVLLIHATWCGHCQIFKPEWEKLVSGNSKNKKIQLLSIESEVFQKLREKDPKLADYLSKTTSSPQLYFPKIMIFSKGDKSIRRSVYEETRSANDLQDFINTKW